MVRTWTGRASSGSAATSLTSSTTTTTVGPESPECPCQGRRNKPDRSDWEQSQPTKHTPTHNYSIPNDPSIAIHQYRLLRTDSPKCWPASCPGYRTIPERKHNHTQVLLTITTTTPTFREFLPPPHTYRFPISRSFIQYRKPPKFGTDYPSGKTLLAS